MDEKNCPVCFEKITIDNSVMTDCKHLFCSRCFFRWLTTKNTCPLCRHDFFDRIIDREELTNDIVRLLMRGEELSIKNMGIIEEIKHLKLENERMKERTLIHQLMEKESLERIIKLDLKETDILKNIESGNRKIRNIKIKKINEQMKQLQLSGSLHF